MAWTPPQTFNTGETVTSAKLNANIRDNFGATFPNEVSAVSWTPTLEAVTTNPAVSSVTGRRYQVGALMFVWAKFVRDTADGNGVYFVTLPTAASGLSAAEGTGAGQAVGSWHHRNHDSLSDNRGGIVALRSSTTVHFQLAEGGLVDNNTPAPTWDVNDVLSFHAVYPVA